MILTAIAFDFGHTLVDERTDPTIESQPIHVMPQVFESLPRISSPMAVWANTGTAVEIDLRRFLDRAGIGKFFTWIVTSVDTGYRKPAPEFFHFALSKCGLSRDQVLFVGNQLNTDILGGGLYGMRTVWLSGSAYRSREDTLSLQDVQPTYKLAILSGLPAL